jgi:hypothetical protein
VWRTIGTRTEAIGHPFANGVVIADEPIGIVGVQTLDSAARASDATVWSWPRVCHRNVGVAFNRVRGVGGHQCSRVDGRFGFIDSAGGF